MNQNPLDAERRSLNNASGRRNAPSPSPQQRPSTDLEEVKRRSEKK